MSIISLLFFIFVLASAALYYILPLKFRWLVLLAASLVFFIWGCGLARFPIFVAMVLVAWGAALLITKSSRKNMVLGLAIGLLALTLIIFKENAFFINNTGKIVRAFGGSFDVKPPSWVAPLGISYYTLALISYLTDVAWGISEAQKNPLKLLLFAGFFPQMTSGPITRYRQISARLFEGNRFDSRNIAFGAQRVLWGLFKKLVIADRLAVLVSTLYGETGSATSYDGVYVWIAAAAYCFLVYTDFGGCMDIVIGVAQVFGVPLPENFTTPFYATSIAEFWRNWHITLGLWLKDYIMYPVLKSSWMGKIRKAGSKKLSKKAAKEIPTYIGMFMTWSLIGFWHGGDWKLIFGAGLFFFMIIAGGMLLKPVFEWMIRILHINTNTRGWIWWGRLRTALLFIVAGSFQRASSLKGGFKMWSKAFTWNPWVLFDGSLTGLGLDVKDLWVLVFTFVLLVIVSMRQRIEPVRKTISRQNIAWRWALWLLLLSAIVLFGMYGEGYNPQDFIYGNY
ncbi:MAG: hypothetical protein LBQ95_07915 [Lachnospiraceae bacterium]|nr:hypothetical protein [Lachnospiraceae bacterium]